MNSRVLIVDDDKKLTGLLSQYLTSLAFDVTVANHPDKGLEIVRTSPPDLVVLDIMLPGMDGFQFCREMRAESDVPIIFLSARGDVNDRIVGLELGGDDYVPKPFDPRELAARIQSVLRRAAERRGESTAPDRLVADLKRRRFLLGRQALDLTTTEYELLTLFVSNAGKILSRQDVTNHLRGVDWNAFDRTIDVLVSRLRFKLNDDPKKPHFLQTVWGKGYVFAGEVTLEAE